MGEETTIRAIHASIAEGPAWHGPAVGPLLEDVDGVAAGARPIGVAHSIHEIVLHMIAWQEYAARAMQDQELRSLEGEEDWPRVTDSSDKGWAETVGRFKKSSVTVRELLNDYDRSALRENVPGRDFSMGVLLHGISHHNAYHSGQIALLKRAMAS